MQTQCNACNVIDGKRHTTVQYNHDWQPDSTRKEKEHGTVMPVGIPARFCCHFGLGAGDVIYCNLSCLYLYVWRRISSLCGKWSCRHSGQGGPWSVRDEMSDRGVVAGCRCEFHVSGYLMGPSFWDNSQIRSAFFIIWRRWHSYVKRSDISRALSGYQKNAR